MKRHPRWMVGIFHELHHKVEEFIPSAKTIADQL